MSYSWVASADGGFIRSDSKQFQDTLFTQEARAHRAAQVIQTAFTKTRLGHDLARFISELGLDEDDLTRPSLTVARESAERSLPRDPYSGELYSLRAPLAAFDELGVEVAVYMRFIVYTGRLFALLTVLNFANLISDMGTGGAEDLLSKMAINNDDCPSNAHGMVELLSSVIIIAFLFWMRFQMYSTAHRLRAQLERNKLLTAANFSVMVDGCAPSVTAAQLRAALGSFGSIVHVGVALDNRQLVLQLERRHELLLRAHEVGIRLLQAVRAARHHGYDAPVGRMRSLADQVRKRSLPEGITLSRVFL